jgi:hypothetical protein
VRALRLALALPVLLAIARAGMLAAAAAGGHPFWQIEPLNLAEAAALRDGGEVARLLGAGADPTVAYTVRRGFLRPRAMTVTPLEAARAAGRPDIEALLIEAGARP